MHCVILKTVLYPDVCCMTTKQTDKKADKFPSARSEEMALSVVTNKAMPMSTVGQNC